VNDEVVGRLHPSLRAILQLELARGNKVVEVTQSDWPRPDSLFVCLNFSFGRRYEEFGEAQFFALQDPRYWGDQYSVEEGLQILACLCGERA